MRELHQMVAMLESEQAVKYVLTRHGKMCAVVISIEHFASLSARRG